MWVQECFILGGAILALTLYWIWFMSEYTQVGSRSKAYLIRIQNHIRSWVWKCTCKELWSFQKSHVISEKHAVHIFWTTHRRKIVLYSIFIRKKRIFGIFHVVFYQYRWKISQNQEKVEKSDRCFFRGSSLLKTGSKLALDFCSIITRMWDLIWVSIQDFLWKPIIFEKNTS